MKKSLVSIIVASLVVVGCGGSNTSAKNPDSESAGDKLEEAAKDTEEAAEKTGEAAEKAAEKTGEAAEEAGDKAKAETKDEE